MDLHASLTVATRYMSDRGCTYKQASAMLVSTLLREAGIVEAGALQDVSKLRYQAVFLMGAGGSGKGFVGQKWMKYMPGAPPGGIPAKAFKEKMKQHMTEAERGLSNLNFEKTIQKLKQKGITIELAKGSEAARIPFRVYTYDEKGRERLVAPNEWEDMLPKVVLDQVRGLQEVVFATPVHELPSYWRQVNPDVYKEELAGYLEKEPGYVHEMSSEMSKAYFEATLESGDPLFVDGVGAKASKMIEQIGAAKAAGYSVSVILVIVPLVVNQIRNALRARNVDPNIITAQWKAVQDSFSQIRGKADVARVVVNRDDDKDAAAYKAKAAEVNDFIRRKTSYDSLYDLIAAESSNELGDWGKVLRSGETGEGPPDPKHVREIQLLLKALHKPEPDLSKMTGEQVEALLVSLKKERGKDAPTNVFSA